MTEHTWIEKIDLKGGSTQLIVQSLCELAYIMTESYIKYGPVGGPKLPQQSLGLILHNSLRNNQNGNKIAIVDANTGQEISYKNLKNLVTQLAINLRKFGIKKGDVITIAADNSSHYLITMMALFFLGATANLLNPDYSINELRHFFNIVKPKAVFVSKKTAKIVMELRKEFASIEVINFDESVEGDAKSINDFFGPVEDSEIAKFQPVDLDPNEDTAVILSSSGTTGFPKGVMLTHSNVRACMQYAGDTEFLNINENEVTFDYLPFFHIFGFALSLASVIFGAKLVAMEKFIPDKFFEMIQKHKVTMLFTVPPIMMFLAKTPAIDKYDLSSIKDVICGAAPVSKAIEDIVENRLKISCVRQLYGMTEVAGAATVIPQKQKKTGSAGKAVIGHQIKVVDITTGSILGPNQDGEICIKGGGTMKGYCNNDAETKAAFDDEGYLKSGDLGHYDEQEYFYIVDRLKEIIKYKGFQVPPAELEEIIHKHPAVREVGVVGVPDDRAGELPMAFVVKQPNKEVTEAEIIRFVAENVSVQKQLHGGVRFVDAIPQSSSGKILRRKLKEML